MTRPPGWLQELVEELADPTRELRRVQADQSSRDLEAVIKEPPHAREESEAP